LKPTLLEKEWIESRLLGAHVEVTTLTTVKAGKRQYVFQVNMRCFYSNVTTNANEPPN
jgi:hypothetical protein